MSFKTRVCHKHFVNDCRLRNKFLNNKTEENKTLYVKENNYCVSHLRKTKKTYYSNLDEKNVTDHRRFWKRGKPMLSDKLTHKKKKKKKT